MERSRATLVTAVCFLFSSISGAEVEMSVRPGEDVTLHCDCEIPVGLNLAWFRNCSHRDQPPLVITHSEMFRNKFPRFSFKQNSSSRSYDLLVKNISERDLGLYYCAVYEKKFSDDVYYYGNLTTLLSLRETTSLCVTTSTMTPTPPVSDCSVCWKLLVSVCPVCVLLSSLISSTCVYWICRSRTQGGSAAVYRGEKMVKHDEVGGGDEVCYASLDLPSKGQKHLNKKKKKVERSDFSTYSEIRMQSM